MNYLGFRDAIQLRITVIRNSRSSYKSVDDCLVTFQAKSVLFGKLSWKTLALFVGVRDFCVLDLSQLQSLGPTSQNV